MSRAKTVCLTFPDFINGPHRFRVPQGYKRIQLNEFSCSFNFIADGPFDIKVGDQVSQFEQKNTHFINSLSTNENPPPFVTLECKGLGAWRDRIAVLTPTHKSSVLGMQGNVYEITEQDLLFTPLTSDGRFFNDPEIVVQFTLL